MRKKSLRCAHLSFPPSPPQKMSLPPTLAQSVERTTLNRVVVGHGFNPHAGCIPVFPGLSAIIVASIPACHVGDRGLIPRRGETHRSADGVVVT